MRLQYKQKKWCMGNGLHRMKDRQGLCVLIVKRRTMAVTKDSAHTADVICGLVRSRRYDKRTVHYDIINR